jgi:lipopolysaccharide biosynthesis protein
MDAKRIIAINLPQFHPFKENDEWWGKGFTEWTNVTKAKPRYPGHYQPQLPTETGFYDLRLPESRKMQADMARESGIYGFCYYHYWFNGHRLMNRPIDEILESGEPQYPFMLCWANENWARNWDGSNTSILMAQNYSDEDDTNHMRWLCEKVFSDPRYIKVEGKPVFVIYKPMLFPDMARTIKTWRRVAKNEYAVDLYLIGVEHSHEDGSKYQTMGFDSSLDFQPVSLNDYKNKSFLYNIHKFSTYVAKAFRTKSKVPLFISYRKYVDYKLKEQVPGYKMYPCVSPGWDNSSRRVGRSFTVFFGSTPSLFKHWLSSTIKQFKTFSKEENFVFINAWNEWAEGNHLEPDNKWGHSYLDAVKEAVKENN